MSFIEYSDILVRYFGPEMKATMDFLKHSGIDPATLGKERKFAFLLQWIVKGGLKDLYMIDFKDVDTVRNMMFINNLLKNKHPILKNFVSRSQIRF